MRRGRRAQFKLGATVVGHRPNRELDPRASHWSKNATHALSVVWVWCSQRAADALGKTASIARSNSSTLTGFDT